MLAPQINTHVQDALARFLAQYQGRPLLNGFMNAFTEQVQVLEDALYPMDALRQIANAYGAQLDGLGALLNLPRNGLNDMTYVLFLYGKIAEDFSDSTITSVITVINYVFQASVVIMQEIYPAGLSVQVAGTPLDPTLFGLAVALVQAAMGAGIQLVFIGGSSTVNIFRFDGPGVVGTVNGFGDLLNPSVGGGFVSIL
jgi:hypothetical protein